ncbi:MAG TPA: FMN-binding protein, partial [Longimicrobiales bacterium]
GAEPGFADVITLIFGYDPVQKRLIGMKVLDNKETPGLGDKIVKDPKFSNGFNGKDTPLLGVKHGAGKGGRNEVDMITGATISSRAVIGIINRKLEKVEPLLPKGPQP